MSAPRTVALAVVLAASTLAAVPSFAHDTWSSVEVEFQNQNERIEQGIRSRQLTRHETAVLRAEQDKIANMIARARLDGRIDSYERREIETAQAGASNHIFTHKHDGQVAEARPVARPGYGFWHRPRSWWY